jgi:hypothetical protein
MISQKRDVFQVSNGNIMTLQTIPVMMEDDHYRKKLRQLALDYLWHTQKCPVLHKNPHNQLSQLKQAKHGKTKNSTRHLRNNPSQSN